MLNIIGKIILLAIFLLNTNVLFAHQLKSDDYDEEFVKKISPMLMFGFPGFSEENPMVDFLIKEIEDNHIDGVVLFSSNIQNSKQLKRLTSRIKDASNAPILIAVDQEGGRIERLSSKSGFHHTKSPKTVAESATFEEAEMIYQDMAKMLFEHGINFNLAPVVDLDNFDAPCPVIGGLGRSFSNNTETVVSYARGFINAHKTYNILTSLKHFPGHGYAPYDSHIGLVDVTETVSPLELIPFAELISEGLADSVMTAHIMNRKLDSQFPATMSNNILQGLLREELSFNGVVISDDMQMGAIQKIFSREEAIVNAILAGCDILIFSNNTPELRKIDDFDFLVNHKDFVTPQMVSQIIYNALKDGRLTLDRIEKSLERIKRLKAQFQELQNPSQNKIKQEL